MGVRLNWTDNNYGEDGHKIYRSESPMDPQSLPAHLATVDADVTSYDDGSAVDGTKYYYRVSATLGAAEMVSDEISITPGAFDPQADPNLIAHWTMDNINGSVLVDEAGNHNGNISGAVSVAGRKNNALDLETTDRVTFSLPAMTVWSLSIWIKLESASSYPHLMSVDGDQGLFALKVRHSSLSNPLRPYLYKSTHPGQQSTDELTLGTWHHLYVFCDGTNSGIEVDGSLTNIPLAFELPADVYAIGYNDGDQPDFNIDDIYVFNRILTAAEKLQLRN